MTVEEYKELLSTPDAERTTLVAGSLLREDRQGQMLRLAVQVIRSWRAQLPSEGDFVRWVNAAGNVERQAKNLVDNSGWGPDVPGVTALLRQAFDRRNDKVWDEQTGRHEYRHTLSVSDDVSPVPPDFATAFPALEHLHLWSFGSLAVLPPLPPRLKTLDLRNAWELPDLPGLPETLETLDLTGCRSLRKLPRSRLPRLKRLYFGRCAALTPPEFEAFWIAAACASSIEEIELHDNAWLRDLRLPSACPRLRVVRASDCPNLAVLPAWEGWGRLEHLDLRNCGELRSLPRLPLADLRYLGLYGCNSLREYLGQDLNERDIGLRKTANVADNFRLRTRLGADVKKSPRCKLLFLGNGRGGKTTLAKALQWREMDETARNERPDLEPKEGEDPTHAIHQWDWYTGLPDAASDDPPARIHIWDFGGQEAYHGTHRVFAASGSLYIVLLSEDLPESEPAAAGSHDYYHQNRQRPPRYWLDYILDLDRTYGSPDVTPAHVLLVHGRSAGKHERRGVLEELRREYAGEKMVLVGEWWVGSLEPEWETSQFEGFREELKKALCRQVREEGVRIPRFFKEVMEEIRSRVRDVTSAKDPNAILAWDREDGRDGWKECVDGCLSRCNVEIPATELDRSAEATARLLHQSGDLFWMHRQGRAVILHQKSVLREIYELLNINNRETKPFRDAVRANYALFESRTLRETWSKSDFPPMLQTQMLEFMTACQICAPLFKPGAEGVVREDMIALDPTLLPDFREIERDLQPAFKGSGFPIMTENWRLKPPRLFWESDFRALQVQAVSHFENRVIVWWNGMQYADETGAAGFRARWFGEKSRDDYGGYLGLEYWRRPEEGDAPASLAVFMQRVVGPGSPLPLEAWITPHQPDRSAMLTPISGRNDVAFSVRGVHKKDAQKLEAALKARNLRVFLYDPDKRESLTEVYEFLRQARVLVLWIGEAYLEPSVANEPTLREFANAILAWLKTREYALEPEIVEELPKHGVPQVFVVWQDETDFAGRAAAALDAMVKHYAKTVGALADARGRLSRESRLYEMFKNAGHYAGTFAGFYLEENRNVSDFAARAPASPADFEALADRIAALLR